MKVYVPPFHPVSANLQRVFLAGSIENGKAVDWQSMVIANLHDIDVDVYNPRRPDWNTALTQSANCPAFAEQVNWELDYLTYATDIAIYFAPDTKSPISLLELGIHSVKSPKKLLVCCPETFWRAGNVEIVCKRSQIQLVRSLDDMIVALRHRLIGNLVGV